MYWDVVSAVAESAGALSVIASLVYLARQIRQSNSSDRMNTTLNIQSSYNDVGDLFLRESQTMSKGFSDIAALDEEEQLKFAIVFHLYFGHIELMHSYEQQGMLDSETLNRTYNGVRCYLQFPGVQTWWNMTGSLTFSKDFVAFVESQAALGSDITHNWGRD